MRKILLTALLAAGGLTASAQNLQNEGFDFWKKVCGMSDQTSTNKKKEMLLRVSNKLVQVRNLAIGMAQMSTKRL